MKILLLGSTGATGKEVLNYLVKTNEHNLELLVRNAAKLPTEIRENSKINIIEASNILALSDNELDEITKDVNIVVSTLGHSISLKGIWGKPRRLVADMTKAVCRSIQRNDSENAVKFILMNTVGNLNGNLDEKMSSKHSFALSLLRTFIPPQADNEEAAEYLRVEFDNPNDDTIQWVAVRPDSLGDASKNSEYDLFESLQTDPLFKPGKTSRINVAHFIVSLISDEVVWNKWKGKMPVIYNKGSY